MNRTVDYKKTRIRPPRRMTRFDVHRFVRPGDIVVVRTSKVASLHRVHHRFSRIPKERFVQMWTASLCDNERHTAACVVGAPRSKALA
jgi:hypothetical protein